MRLTAPRIALAALTAAVMALPHAARSAEPDPVDWSPYVVARSHASFNDLIAYAPARGERDATTPAAASAPEPATEPYALALCAALIIMIARRRFKGRDRMPTRAGA